MDFFQNQAVAHRRTTWLVVLFVAAVLSIIIVIHLVLVGILSVASHQARQRYSYQYDSQPVVRVSAGDPRLFLAVAGGVILVVGLGSLYKIAALSAGGQAVALGLGGRRIAAGTTDPAEKRLLNVVEEMAIASGVPVPPVFVLDEETGINAFAAGHAPSDAVITITRGALNLLNRDELQGVIGHEFSHILNGDMKLNIRLMGVIYGILLIGLIGYGVLRVIFSGGVRVRSSSDKKDGGGAAIIAIAAIGVTLLVLGYIGVFFGNLIKAAVSRQREFLADASSVQFTRNPAGITGALKKIGGFWQHSLINHAQASEVSHMFFGQGFDSAFDFLFATHPPLTERIRRIDPAFDGKFPEIAPPPDAVHGLMEQYPGAAPGLAGIAELSTAAVLAQAQAAGAAERSGEKVESRGGGEFSGAGALQHIGQPTTAHLDYAAQLLSSIPDGLRHAASEPWGARAVILGLLLSADADVRRVQMEHLASNTEGPVYQEIVKLLPVLDSLPHPARLPLINITLPALQRMAAGQYQQFKKAVADLIAADHRVDLFEWMVQHILRRHLEPHYTTARPKPVQYYALKMLAQPCATLLATLAYIGQDGLEQAQRAFAKGWTALDLPAVPLPDRSACKLSALEDVLMQLDTVAPKCKRDILTACAACITADSQVTEREAELFRAVADALGCPVPPLLPGQPLA